MAYNPKGMGEQDINEYLQMVAEWDRKSDETRGMITTMLNKKVSPEIWRGMMAVPPGSVLESVLEAFKMETDIPLELPFFTMLHFISGYLLSKRIKMTGKFGSIYPELWTIVLAESGTGKTFAHDQIAKHAPVKSEFPECNSGAKFIDAFQENNFGLWFQDEIAQKMKQIETPQSPLADVKEYLLKAYSNDKIERSTMKGGTITINEPCLGILGLNTPASFYKSVSPESLLDGFMQRFACVVAEADPDRDVKLTPEQYALYDAEALQKASKRAFDKLLKVQLHSEYRLSREAEQAYIVSFGLLINSEDIPTSFFRRIMFRGFRYALLYHIILGKTSVDIDKEDIGWGARVAALHLSDYKKLFTRDDNFGTLEKLITRTKILKQRCEDEGKEFTHRYLQQQIGGKLKASGAKVLIGLV